MTGVQKPNAQYNVAKPTSLPIRVAARARRRMYERFLQNTAIEPSETLLDVGVTSDQSYESSNYVEVWYPYKDKITAVGMDDASFLEERYPGLRYCRADGRNLPFGPSSFDVVHSSAVLEHVGSSENQKQFIAELVRVAKRAVFLTTPNRWFPVEFHSVLPLVHWLPKPWFRSLLSRTSYRFFALEENLNLLDRREILQLCSGLDGCRISVESQRLLGMPSNLLVTIQK
jgi:ubiquinone/menaquinone biosynthesis C-methylase UbiE